MLLDAEDAEKDHIMLKKRNVHHAALENPLN